MPSINLIRVSGQACQTPINNVNPPSTVVNRLSKGASQLKVFFRHKSTFDNFRLKAFLPKRKFESTLHIFSHTCSFAGRSAGSKL